MIPQLPELPPLPEEDHPLKKLVRPLLGALVIFAMTLGVVWLFNSGLKNAAQEEMGITEGLRGVAADLWSSGAAPEIRVPDPRLTEELARLRSAALSVPQIVVVEAENLPGQPPASHELIYLRGTVKLLSVRVLLDREAGKVDILSYLTGPDG